MAITPACNLNCIYCDPHNFRSQDRPGAMEDFRSKSLQEGVLSTDQYIRLIEALHEVGFNGMTLTGGEPFLNPNWVTIVESSKAIGMERVGVTTNGMLLEKYLREHGRLPDSLSLLTISLDATDPERFRQITQVGDLNQVMRGLRLTKESNPQLLIRANKVVLKSDLPRMADYVTFCQQSGVIDEINLLNLILKRPENIRFFQREFVSASTIISFFGEQVGLSFSEDGKHEHTSRLPERIKIIVKDTNLTMRADQCLECPIYCQEGFFTMRIATDGTIMNCPDYSAQLPHVDGLAELATGTLQIRVKGLAQVFDEVTLEHTLQTFFEKYGIELEE